MHDPLTVAIEIKYPWWKYRPWPKRIMRRHGTKSELWERLTPDERRGRSKAWPDGYRNSFITIWHCDPETNGSDDSCGFSVPHLSREQRDRLRSLAWSEARNPYFLQQSGRVWSGSQAEAEAMWRGLVLQICEYAHVPMTFNDAAKRAALAIHNPDCCPIANRLCFQPGYHANSAEDRREDREEYFFGLCCNVLRWILRDRRPWYHKPKWHVHHWRIQCHPWQAIRRWLFDRCEVCGTGFPYGASVISTCWDRPKATGLARLAFWRSETHIRHDKCDGVEARAGSALAASKGAEDE